MMKKNKFWCVILAVALTAASGDKIDPLVLDRVEADGRVAVIIYAADREGDFEPDRIKQEYRWRIETISGDIRAISERTRQEPGPLKKGGDSPGEEEKAELADLLAALNFELDQMRWEIARAAAESSGEGLRLLAQTVVALGGEPGKELHLANAISAKIPVEALAVLGGMPRVGAIGADHRGGPEVDLSMDSCGFDTWWNLSFTGGGTDFGIVDNGIFEGHQAFAHIPYIDHPAPQPAIGEHGTQVAGVVVMESGSHKGGAFGVNSMIWDNGEDEQAATMEAMEWVATHELATPEVLNFSRSLGPMGPDTNSLEAFVDSLIEDFELLVIKSAGNLGWEDFTSTLTSPGRAFNLISVAAMDDMGTVSRLDDVRRGTSSVGPTPWGRRKPDLCAPGVDIYTTEKSGGYIEQSGTSLAAPHVAAAVLLLSQNGNVNPMAQKAVLINTASPWSSQDTQDWDDDGPTPISEWDKSYGWGYLDMDRAYAERNDYITDDIFGKSPTSGGPSVRFYETTLDQYDKVTLVWHRHTHQFSGPGYYDLNDLGLALFDANVNNKVATDDSILDNVHQVQWKLGVSLNAVIKVYSNETVFQGVVRENFALAGVPPGLTFKFPPKGIWNIVDGPVWVHPLDPVTVKIQIQNQGELTAHQNHMTVDYGRTGIVPADGNYGPIPLPSLAPEESIVYELALLADVPEGEYELAASLVFGSYEEEFPADDLAIVVVVPRH